MRRKSDLILKILIFFAVVVLPASCLASGVVNAEQVLELSKDSNSILVDVRTEREFRRGHIPGAVNIPLHALGDRLDELDRTKSIVVYCRSGNRSRVAERILADQGFTDVLNFEGSWRVWSSKGYPVSFGNQ